MNRPYVIVGLAVIVGLLAGAAYVGGQLLSGGGAAKGAVAQAGPPRKIVTQAAGMPSTPPDGRGDVTRMGDKNSIFICDDIGGLAVNADGSVANSSEDCKPEIEVFIGHDTQMYRDISAKVNVVKPDASKDVVISQVVEPANGADITTGTAIRVWGDRRGDRITAHVVLFEN